MQTVGHMQEEPLQDAVKAADKKDPRVSKKIP